MAVLVIDQCLLRSKNMCFLFGARRMNMIFVSGVLGQNFLIPRASHFVLIWVDTNQLCRSSSENALPL